MNMDNVADSLVAGVVLEGLSTAGKTSVLRAIKQEQANEDGAERSVVILGEHYSQQLQQIHGKEVSLSAPEHAALLADRLLCIENLNAWANKLGPYRRSSRGLFYLFERFHLNHRFAYGETADIAGIEARLCNLGCQCILLTVSPDRVPERL